MTNRPGTPDAHTYDVVILDRIADVPHPDYCIHGRTTCISCNRWCWVGTATGLAVQSRSYAPLCRACAVALLPPGTRVDGHLDDRPRSAGPH